MFGDRILGKWLPVYLMAAVALTASTFVVGGLSAQDKPTYKIAYIGPITGPNTSVGVGTMNSLDLAIRQANASGNLPFKLEFIYDTDDSRPAAGVAAVQKICSDKSVIAASAHWNSPVAMATGPYFNECGLLNLIAGAAANPITKQGWAAVGRVNTPVRYSMPHLAAVAYKELGIRKVAAIHSLDDYGNDLTDSFLNAFKALGGEVVFRDGYNVGDRDFTSLLTKMRSARPDAVFPGGVNTEMALILRQMRQLGLNQPYLCHPGCQAAYVQATGPVGNGTLAVTVVPRADELAGGEKFLADYKAAGFSNPPDVYGPFGYTVGQVFVELIKRYGADRKALITNFRQAKDLKTLLGTQHFDEDGELQPKALGMSVLEDGDWKPFDAAAFKKKYMK